MRSRRSAKHAVRPGYLDTIQVNHAAIITDHPEVEVCHQARIGHIEAVAEVVGGVGLQFGDDRMVVGELTLSRVLSVSPGGDGQAPGYDGH